MNRISRAIFVAIILTCSVGCDSVGRKSPSEVVKAVYMAANEGKYSEIKKYLSSNLVALADI